MILHTSINVFLRFTSILLDMYAIFTLYSIFMEFQFIDRN